MKTLQLVRHNLGMTAGLEHRILLMEAGNEEKIVRLEHRIVKRVRMKQEHHTVKMEHHTEKMERKKQGHHIVKMEQRKMGLRKTGHRTVKMERKKRELHIG